MIDTDVVIIGAGPCGLFQAFELGLFGLKAEVVDSIRQLRGQCTELYPDKPIYDIPAIPVCSGEELTEALLKQIKPFNCGMHLGEDVSVARKNRDDSLEGKLVDVPASHVLVFFGLAPKLGTIAEWGLDVNRETINVDTERFESSEPGIYAIGDINYYPGKKKLILCGFHEAALAAFAIKQRIEPDKKVHLQYTTTSPIMHKRLGVAD